MHDYIGAIDINSLYPSTIRALNMGPETIVGQLRQTMTDSYLAAKMANGSSWTDVVDVGSNHGGPSAITAADQASLADNGFTNNGGDWTLMIKSGTAVVDEVNKQVNFTSDHANNEIVITTADGTTHDITNVDKVQWHGQRNSNNWGK